MMTVLFGIEGVFENVKRSSFIEFDFENDKASYKSIFELSLETNKEITSGLSKFTSIDDLLDGRQHYQPNLPAKKGPSESDLQNIKDGVKSYLLTPLMKENKLFGAIAVGFDSVNTLSDIETSMFYELSAIVSTTLIKTQAC